MPDEKEEELDLWFPGNTVNLESGEKLAIPKLTWGRENKCLRIILRVFKNTPELKGLRLESVTADMLLSILPALLDSALVEVNEFLEILLAKDVKWIEDNLALEDVVKLILPFVRRSLSKITALLPKAVEEEEATSVSQT